MVNWDKLQITQPVIEIKSIILILKKLRFFLRPTNRDHIKEEPVNLSYYRFTQSSFTRPVCTFLQHQRDLNAQ